MDRLALEQLEQWFASSDRKPLIIWGSRQVGKTYLLQKLFMPLHKGSVYIDLAKDDEARAFFSTTSDPDKYLRYIEARYGKKITSSTPLIFDEMQKCLSVLTSLKYFQQDHPEIPVIATGSMVRLAITEMPTEERKDFLFPLGKVDSLDLYPITFDEYLLNTNPVILERIEDAYRSHRPLEKYEHEMAMDLLHEYLSVGGMPEAVDVFLRERSYVDVRKVLESIYDNFLADMSQYNISAETILKTRRVYQSIFSQINKENKNYKISLTEKGRSNRDYLNAYTWLELARVVVRSRNKVGKVTLPLTEDSSLFRLYLADMGMFTYQSGVPFSDFLVKDKRSGLAGVFYENYVAMELTARGIELFYWTGKSGHEFEFIVRNGNKVIPLDVKKGTGKLNSLQDFRNSNPQSVAVKVSSNNYGYDEGTMMLTIPHYEMFMLARDIAGGVDLESSLKGRWSS